MYISLLKYCLEILSFFLLASLSKFSETLLNILTRALVVLLHFVTTATIYIGLYVPLSLVVLSPTFIDFNILILSPLPYNKHYSKANLSFVTFLFSSSYITFNSIHFIFLDKRNINLSIATHKTY